MALIQARVKLTNGDGKVYVKDSPVLNVNTGGESTLELREGTFTSLSGGTLTLANGSSTTFTPGISTTYNVAAAQAGVANFKGTSPNYTVRGTSLVKVLKYPNNATSISHENSPNLIEVPSILPPNVTVLANMFWGCTNFNQNINSWNVSKVKDMRFMFRGCTNFNQPLNSWDVSSVTDMDSMFWGCTKFNQPLNNWDVSSVTDMRCMFINCTNFKQSLNTWNVSNVVTMDSMFWGCTNFNQPLNNWDVSSVTDMSHMFIECTSFNQNINNWNVSKVTDMKFMFGDCKVFNQPLNNWNVSKVTGMSHMFYSCSSFNQPLDKWNVSSVTDMKFMFGYCTRFSQDLSKWCVSLITTKPLSFNDNAPLLTAAKLPVWGTCPNPSLTSTASWYRDANLTTPVGKYTKLRDTYCVFDLKNVKGGEVLELTGHSITLTIYTIDVTLLSDSSKLTSPIGFNTSYALYKSPDRGNIPMRTIPITIPKGITGNVRLVFKSSASTLHHSLDRGASVFDFILKHNNVQIGVIKTAYSS